jgi:hypothetical protein
MSNAGGPQPDPSVIGTIAKPPFVQLPDPARMLGRDLLVREAGFRRGAINPFLRGY